MLSNTSDYGTKGIGICCETNGSADGILKAVALADYIKSRWNCSLACFIELAAECFVISIGIIVVIIKFAYTKVYYEVIDLFIRQQTVTIDNCKVYSISNTLCSMNSFKMIMSTFCTFLSFL